MDDTIDELIIAVRADTRGFERDMAALKSDAEGGLSQGFARASNTLERGLVNAVRQGRVGFDDLKRVALAAMADIAAGAIRSGLSSIGAGGQGGGGGGGGILAAAAHIAAAFAGAPGRATGGPVSPGRAYRVGENGPEYFVPTSAGSVASGFGAAPSSAPNITLNIRVNGDGGGGGGGAQNLHRSARHIAHAVRGALNQ